MRIEKDELIEKTGQRADAKKEERVKTSCHKKGAQEKGMMIVRDRENRIKEEHIMTRQKMMRQKPQHVISLHL